MKKILLVIIGIIFVTSCQTTGPHKKKSATKITQIPPEITTQHCSLSSFDSVMVNGDTKVEIVNGTYGMDITGIQGNYKCPSITGNRVLNISNIINKKTKRDANTVIKVCAPELKNIIVTNNALVSTQDFKTSGLSIVAKDNGTINLEGQFDINKISQTG